RSCGGSAVTSSPKNRTRPRVAGKSPVTTLNRVVLPAPLAPITARRSPTATENETSSIACSAPNVRVTPSSWRASPDTRVDECATSNPPADQEGPGARRRPTAAREAYFLWLAHARPGSTNARASHSAAARPPVERAAEGANEADGPSSSACYGQLGSSREPTLNSAG